MSPLLKFTALRIALFLAALMLLYVAGARDWLLLLLAAVVSLALSYVLLRGPRDELAAALQQHTAERLRRRSRADEDAAAEDAAVDSAEPDEPPGR